MTWTLLRWFFALCLLLGVAGALGIIAELTLGPLRDRGGRR